MSWSLILVLLLVTGLRGLLLGEEAGGPEKTPRQQCQVAPGQCVHQGD